MPSFCFLCGQAIVGDLQTEEHVFPNAIGGILTVTDFICRPCNSRTGHSWDSLLNKKYEVLTAILRINRDRGETPPCKITLDGKQAWITQSGSFVPAKPTISEVVGPDGKKKKVVQASSVDVARQYAETLRGTVSDAAIDKGLAEAGTVKSYPAPGVITFADYFDALMARSATKTALAFAHSLGIPALSCTPAVNFLKDAESAGVSVWEYFVGDILPPCTRCVLSSPDAPVALPLHIVAVQSHPNGNLTAYVEYFGYRRLIICLSSTYSGPPVRGAYILDPLSGNEMPPVFRDLPSSILPTTDTEVAAATIAALGAVMGLAHLRDWIRERDRVLNEALVHAFAVCGADPKVIPDPAMAERLKAVAQEQMKPWLEAQHLATASRSLVPPVG